jgi:hypothetical protein
MSRTPKPRQAVKIHVHGNATHNIGILVAIGGLIVNWANNESVFMAMLQVLIGGGEHTAAITWQSLRTSRGRLELVARLVREQVKDSTLVSDIERSISQFEGVSRARNFYCHATYEHDPIDGAILGAHGMTVSNEGPPIIFERKLFNRGTINEIGDASMRLAAYNRHLWSLVERLQTALGVQRVKLPELPPLDPQAPESRPRQNGDVEP